MHCNLSLPYFNRLSLGCWENLEEKYLLKVEAFFHPSFSKLSQENQLHEEVRYQHSLFLTLSSSKVMTGFQDS